MIITLDTILIRLSVACFDNVLLKHRPEGKGHAVGPFPPPPPTGCKGPLFLLTNDLVGLGLAHY